MQGLEPINVTITNWSKLQEKEELARCPVCGETILKKRDDVRKPIGDMHLVQCIKCGFVTYSPQPKNIMDYYRTQVRAQTVKFIATKANKLGYHRKMLVEFLRATGKEYTSMLDYGCSDGYLMKLFLEEVPGAKYAKGIELNPGHANWAKVVERLDVTADCDLSKITDKFDLVSIYHVLEHVQRPDKFIKEIWKKLKVGGLLYIALPTLSRLEYDSIQGIGNCLFKDEHINFFTDDLLEAFLEFHGFHKVYENKEIYGTCFILKKVEEFVDCAFDFYEENNQVLENVKQVYAHLEEAMSVMHRDTQLSVNLIRKGLGYYDNFLIAIKKASAVMDPIDTIDWYREWLEKKPNLIELNLALGVELYNDRELDEAIKYMLIYNEKHGYSPVCHQYLALAHYYKGEVETAVRYLMESYKNNPVGLECIELTGTMLKDF